MIEGRGVWFKWGFQVYVGSEEFEALAEVGQWSLM